jgi:hypothetical protein
VAEDDDKESTSGMDSSHVCSSTNDLGSFDDSLGQHGLWRGWDPTAKSTLSLLLLKRALGCRSLDSSIQKKVYEPLLVNLNLTKYSELYERVSLAQTLSRLVYDLDQEPLEECRSRFPSRAYLL